MSESSDVKQGLSIFDLKPRMRLEGRVTRLELFGAFVDVGAEREGLLHISQLGQRVNRVSDLLSVGDDVTVWVQSVEPEQGRISLTMIKPPDHPIAELKPDMILSGTVTKLTPYGAFVDIGAERDGLVHISEMAEGRIEKPEDVVQEGEQVVVRVLRVSRKKRRIELSMRGVPGEEEEEEVEEEPMTAMELAWRNAMERRGVRLSIPARKRGRRRKRSDIRRQQAAIIARTLQAMDR